MEAVSSFCIISHSWPDVNSANKQVFNGWNNKDKPTTKIKNTDAMDEDNRYVMVYASIFCISTQRWWIIYLRTPRTGLSSAIKMYFLSACASIDSQDRNIFPSETQARTAEIKRYMFGIRSMMGEIKQYHDTPSRVYTIIRFGRSM
jgi:hypothetical protein